MVDKENAKKAVTDILKDAGKSFNQLDALLNTSTAGSVVFTGLPSDPAQKAVVRQGIVDYISAPVKNQTGGLNIWPTKIFWGTPKNTFNEPGDLRNPVGNPMPIDLTKSTLEPTPENHNAYYAHDMFAHSMPDTLAPEKLAITQADLVNVSQDDVAKSLSEIKEAIKNLIEQTIPEVDAFSIVNSAPIVSTDPVVAATVALEAAGATPSELDKISKQPSVLQSGKVVVTLEEFGGNLRVTLDNDSTTASAIGETNTPASLAPNTIPPTVPETQIVVDNLDKLPEFKENRLTSTLPVSDENKSLVEKVVETVLPPATKTVITRRKYKLRKRKYKTKSRSRSKSRSKKRSKKRSKSRSKSKKKAKKSKSAKKSPKRPKRKSTRKRKSLY